MVVVVWLVVVVVVVMVMMVVEMQRVRFSGGTLAHGSKRFDRWTQHSAAVPPICVRQHREKGGNRSFI